MVVLSMPEMIEILAKIDKKTCVSLITCKDAKLLKKSRLTKNPTPYTGMVVVTTITNLFIGEHYTNAVNKTRIDEGKPADFEVGKLPFGQWLNGSSTIIVDGDKYYLRTLSFADEPSTSKKYYYDALQNRHELDELGEYLPAKTTVGEHSEQNISGLILPLTFSMDTVSMVFDEDHRILYTIR